ncbi:uncharacterized protein THITE_122669 [Thermothielavioides terrestris NRRL 8126]|uniref:RNA recognition motif-containing protein n=1 Tax=Thermothielavioides terrestris (strain ATCC 38088 / NRRL 8126) TaxID=578455 RepID=G2RCA5_THETT|nr:uncharacterized protein THITE_122669 [Thermothielavioides terrestris NRRL 8126]AEO70540.1 hypothetical protein THITE_122669 [Thermothielavioides terrestris NRRL 8126]
MAARPGEENVATLYGDIHYFYGPPTDNPPHHRFDKGSYVYLFEDANKGRARLEIANHPGTDAQDAFDGYLDKVRLRYSYKHTCLVSLTVGEVEGHDEWHLPTYDPHNQNKYHYKLHSLDIYFWTPQDAVQFVNGIRRVLPPAQCEVLDEPGPPPRHSAEPNNGATPAFAGPPVSAVASNGDASPPPPPPQYTTFSYNPAAPPAPEQVRHREKTPPPEDGVANPLQQTLARDASTPFSPGLLPSGMGPLSPGVPPPNIQHPPGAPTFPGPPQHSVTSPGFAPQGFGSLGGQAMGGVQHPGVPRTGTMPAPGIGSPLASPGLASPYGVGTFPPGHAPYTPGVTHTPTPPAAAVGLASPPGQAPQQNEYAVHQQFYIPESQYKPKQEVRGKLEENAARLERGVTGMLKKFEKKFG